MTTVALTSGVFLSSQALACPFAQNQGVSASALENSPSLLAKAKPNPGTLLGVGAVAAAGVLGVGLFAKARRDRDRAGERKNAWEKNSYPAFPIY